MPDRVTSSRCVPVDQRVDMLVNAVTNIIANGGASYDAGCGIDATALTGGTIQAAVDGVSVICEDGVLKAVAASDLTAGCGINIDTGVISVIPDGVTIDCVDGYLTYMGVGFSLVTVSGQSPVTADTFDSVLNFEAGANVTITTTPASNRVTIASSYVDTTYTAGAGINLSSTKFVADPHTASHVGLVDPTTGDDSTADDAQIGILWHNIQDYSAGRTMLLGHLEDDSTKPVVQYKTTEDWMELLEGYDNTKAQVICNDPAQTGNEDSERVRWVDSPQKVIWGIDPAGGHTFETSGTTVTVTLKALKHTFDAVNWVSSVAEDIEIVYEDGEECEGA